MDSKENIKIESLGVIAKLTNGKIYQVALSSDKLEALESDLRMLYFNNNKIELLDKDLSKGIDIESLK